MDMGSVCVCVCVRGYRQPNVFGDRLSRRLLELSLQSRVKPPDSPRAASRDAEEPEHLRQTIPGVETEDIIIQQICGCIKSRHCMWYRNVMTNPDRLQTVLNKYNHVFRNLYLYVCVSLSVYSFCQK